MKKIIVAILAFCLVMGLKAQSFKVQTNGLAWAAQTANVGGGLVLNDYSSLDFNVYKTIGESWVRDADFFGLQIDYRYWLAKQPLQDFFVGLSLMPMKFDNIRLNSRDPERRRKEGSMMTACVNFGYCWPLTARWSLDIVYGVGGAYIYYQDESVPDIHDGHTYWREHQDIRLIPANLGVNISYIIK